MVESDHSRGPRCVRVEAKVVEASPAERIGILVHGEVIGGPLQLRGKLGDGPVGAVEDLEEAFPRLEAAGPVERRGTLLLRGVGRLPLA